MISEQMDLSAAIPLNATSVRFTYTIAPPTGAVTIRRSPEDTQPLSLYGPRGNVDLTLHAPQKIFLEYKKGTVFRLAVSGYGF
jgi:hypothetical protein